MYVYICYNRGKIQRDYTFIPTLIKKSITSPDIYIYIYIYIHKDHHFIAFNIVNFYPSISYKPLKDARTFAASYTSISV